MSVEAGIHARSSVPAEAGAPVRRVSPRRVLSAATLAAWAGLFWYLIASGQTSLYLSSRTAWVVPVGAILLTIAGVGRLLSLRSARPEPVKLSEAASGALVVLPVVVVLALPPATLGTFAASRRSSLAGAGFAGSAGDISTGEVTLVDVAAALRSKEAMQSLVKRAGSDVSFVGFVSRDPSMPADEFSLTRFLISCCAADALTVQTRVVGAPAGKFHDDDWVRVEGQIFPLGREVLVDAASVAKVSRPAHPYLNP